MMNTITKAERQRIDAYAETVAKLYPGHGSVIDFPGTVQHVMEVFGISRDRAERSVAKAARRQRHPDYQPPSPGRPAAMEAGEPVNVYLPANLRDVAERLGGGNISEGVRIALASVP